MTSNLLNSLELSQQWNKTLMFSSRQMNWNGVLVEQCQSPASAFEMELPALSDHWLYFHTGDPAPLVQKRGDRLHESILHKGDSFLVPAGQPSYWCQAPDMSDVICAPLHICLKPEFIKQVAEASDIDSKRFDLVHCFGQQDLQLDQIGMLMFALVAIGWDDGAIICRITHSNPGDSFTTTLFDPNATDWITKQQLNSYPVAAGDRLHPRSSESRFILG